MHQTSRFGLAQLQPLLDKELHFLSPKADRSQNGSCAPAANVRAFEKLHAT